MLQKFFWKYYTQIQFVHFGAIWRRLSKFGSPKSKWGLGARDNLSPGKGSGPSDGSNSPEAEGRTKLVNC